MDQISKHKQGRMKMSDVFGKANYDGGFKKRNWWKLKDGQSVYRILPPMGELREDGIYSVFWKVHYGYKNSKKQTRVFHSPEIKNFKTKMIENPDAALERIQKLKAQFEEAKKTGNVELVARLDKLVGQKGQYNLDNNHYLNAMDQQGNIGLLRIRHRAKLALEATLKELKTKGVDPLDPQNGRFLIFKRSGTGLDTNFKVDVLKETINVEGVGQVERDIVHVITKDLADRMVVFKDGKFVYKEAGRLDTLFKKPTSAQVARIVAEGAPAVDEILDAKEGEESVEAPDPTEGEEEVTPKVVTPVQAQAATAPEAGVAQTADAFVMNSAFMSTSSAPKTTAQNITEMSDEDFLATLG